MSIKLVNKLFSCRPFGSRVPAIICLTLQRYKIFFQISKYFVLININSLYYFSMGWRAEYLPEQNSDFNLTKGKFYRLSFFGM